jgi:hypothetical protein
MATLSANGRKLEMSSYTLNNASILEVFCGRDTPPNSVSGGLVSIMSCEQVCAKILSTAFGFCRLTIKPDKTHLFDGSSWQ